MKRRLVDAVTHLRERDAVLRPVIDAAGPCVLRTERDRFRMLVRSIIGQQLSSAAARTIAARLYDRVGAVTPEALRSLTTEEFRALGISSQKESYLRDLAARVDSGALRLDDLGRFSDEVVIERLVAVRGVGRWTAQMFLIFSLGRLDVLPHDDQGVRGAMRRIYGLPEPPTRAEMDRIAEPWRPYASVACWYCWRSLEARPDVPANGAARKRRP